MKMKPKKHKVTNLEIFDEKVSQYRKVDTVGPVTYDEETNTIEFSVRKTSVKSDLILTLLQLETHEKAHPSLRAQAAGIRPMLNELIVDIRSIDGEKESYTYTIVDPVAAAQIGTIIPHDKLIYDEQQSLKKELNEGPENPYRVVDIKKRLEEIDQIMNELAESAKDRQPEIIESIVHNSLSTAAFGIAFWCLRKNKSLDQYFRQRKKPDKPGKADLHKLKGEFYRVSGHLEDLKIPSFQREKSLAPLFDRLDSHTQTRVRELGVDMSEFNRVGIGIDLSPGEWKLVDCICKMLHEKSQNSKANEVDFYAGNEESEMIRFGIDEKNEQRYMLSPTISFSIYELTKMFRGEGNPSGKDIINVRKILHTLAQKNYPICYERHVKLPNNNTKTDRVKTYQPLFDFLNGETEIKNESGTVVDGQDIYKIGLNPVFRDQIDTKFVKYPADITQRTVEAYGHHNIAASTLILRTYLLRERSANRAECTISLNNLYWQLCKDWMREGRKKKVIEYTDKAIETMKRLGVLSGCNIVPGKNGEQNVVFTLNKEWI